MRWHVAGAIIGGFLGGVLFAIAVALLVDYLIVRAGELPGHADAQTAATQPAAARTSTLHSSFMPVRVSTARQGASLQA
jgi:hypothetical protein